MLPSYDSWIGRAIRLPLRLVPKGRITRILTGPVRGGRWIVGAGNHGCWLGTYEFGQSRRIRNLLRPGMTVYDVGANVGYYTLLSSRYVGPTGRVIAFEPLPENLAYLRRHVELNDADNVEIVAAAVADESGTRRFQTSTSVAGHLADEGDLEVRCLVLDEEMAKGQPAPDVIKMDIEGAEVGALRGASELLARHRPVLILATHGFAVQEECRKILTDMGYRIEVIGSTGLELVDLLAEPMG